MPHFLPIKAKRHRKHGWCRYENYKFAAYNNVAPLVIKEVTDALQTFPLGFRWVSENHEFELVAILSLHPDLNLFVHPYGRWIGGYIPAIFRSYPFRLLPEEGSTRKILCIDTDSGLYREQLGPQVEPFCDEQGNISPLLSEVMDFLQVMEKQHHLTRFAVNELARQGLIVPWETTVKDGNGNALPFNEFYKIDEAAMNALPMEAFEEVRKANGVTIAYAQIFSQTRLHSLPRLYKLREQMNSKASDIDIEKIFEQDDSFRFNFDI